MPTFVISPLLMIALGVFGAGVAIRWVTKEVHRVNADIEKVRAGQGFDAAARQAMPTLRRDPRSGEWRVM